MRSAPLAWLAGLTLLAGCSMAPDYRPPVVAAPAAYKNDGNWVAATPQDAVPRGLWWQVYDDPVLNDLEARVEKGSPTLAAALARHDQARAAVKGARADLFPTLDAEGAAERDRLSANRPLQSKAAKYDNYTVGGSLSWELDLWGRVRNSVKAARAEAQATDADLASVRLALQTELADTYFTLRGLDAQTLLLQQTVEAYSRAYDLTAKRHSGGIASGLDTNRAQTQLSSVRAQLSDLAIQRAMAEDAVAALVGEVASSFTLAPARLTIAPPAVPNGAPSTLLQRRPDIAAAERRVAAANSRIGVAKAAFFPTVTLGASGGYETTGPNLLSAPNLFWAIGPAAAVLNLFDGGKRIAATRQARAEFDEAAANYRSTVLTAFKEVEDNLAQRANLAVEARDQQDAAAAAQRTSDLAFVRYRDGASDYLEVVTAQTAALDAQRTALNLYTRRLQASVDAVRVLGGAYD
ncbi:efflux transporter outer membrane subunit [Flavisphingomonas formosensis]|uniref:efflux transporter outer membrane subunit n=1 Tax=Flavisphingomonas formosensis TaxID=861534 RepID=UPI0012F8B2BB|nr:efflux transporter outer membrane subunit [Sphingomonas formosensis]